MDSGQKSAAPPPYSTEPQGPPPGFYPPPPVAVPAYTTTVYPGGVAVVTTFTPMGALPGATVCKSCHQNVTTIVRHKATTKTHLLALLLCIVGCWPCVCIPYCMDSCQNIDHYCPNCEAYLGTYVG